MPQNYKQMSEEEFDALMEQVNSGEGMGPEEVFACNASPHDHLHFRLIGSPGDPCSRLGIFTHGPTGMTTMFFSATDARSLAEHFNSIAEDIDGQAVSYDVPDDLTSLMDGLNEPPDEDDK